MVRTVSGHVFEKSINRGRWGDETASGKVSQFKSSAFSRSQTAAHLNEEGKNRAREGSITKERTN